VLRDFVEVTRFQTEQIMNTSGFNNNFRPPMPLYGRVVEDGSVIVNSSVTWAVKVCCIKSDDVLIITSSVSKVLGLSKKAMKIDYFSMNGDRSLNIAWEITVIENTNTFLTNLLLNLNDVDFMENIKDIIGTDLKNSKVSAFESVLVTVDGKDSVSSWHYPYNVTEWGKVADICEYGKMQSPIDLPKHSGVKQKEINVAFGTSNLKVSHGHSLKWSLVTDDKPTLYLSGIQYELLQ
jgi:hypothetical protein